MSTIPPLHVQIGGAREKLQQSSRSVGSAGDELNGLAPVALRIGHCPRDDRQPYRARTWLWLGQLHDDPQSMSRKEGDPLSASAGIRSATRAASAASPRH